jgi:enoyl-CoA hydratase/carnithine racemase
MRTFDEYSTRYPHLRMERRDGILQVSLHTDGGPYLHSGHAHKEFPHAFHDISADRDNRVVIITGTGEKFCDEIDGESFGALDHPENWYDIFWEGKRLLTSLLDIEVPVIGVVNGPAHVHSEIPLLCDIVLASDTASFQDKPHLEFGVVPGDGVHLVWPLLLGEIRGRYFLLTRQIIEAKEAKDLGIVNEVLPSGDVLARAWEIAEELNQLPSVTLRYTRNAMTARWKRLIHEGAGFGLALEGLSAAATPPTS